MCTRRCLAAAIVLALHSLPADAWLAAAVNLRLSLAVVQYRWASWRINDEGKKVRFVFGSSRAACAAACYQLA